MVRHTQKKKLIGKIRRVEGKNLKAVGCSRKAKTLGVFSRNENFSLEQKLIGIASVNQPRLNVTKIKCISPLSSESFNARALASARYLTHRYVITISIPTLFKGRGAREQILKYKNKYSKF